MRTFAYNINLDKLDKLVSTNLKNIDSEHKKYLEIREKNRLEMLRCLVPLSHGILYLHNSNMMQDNTSTTNISGILGLSRINIEDTIDNIVNDKPTFPFRYKFSSNCDSVEVEVGNRSISLWLHKFGKHCVNKNQSYSMTTLDTENRYGTTIEKELEIIAKIIAKRLV